LASGPHLKKMNQNIDFLGRIFLKTERVIQNIDKSLNFKTSLGRRNLNKNTEGPMKKLYRRKT
jgi:hypothetical protein